MNQSPPICDYEDSDYQQRFWEQGGRAYEDLVEAIALRALLPPGAGRLLEVGAGAGRNTLRYRGYDQIVLLDYSRTQLRQAQDRLGRSERYLYVAADVYRLPFAPGLFQAATMIRTLHHMADPLAALRQVRAALEPEALFILEYANKRNVKAIGRWLLRRQSWSPFDLRPVEFAPLNFDFHPRTVRRWLQQAGFRVRRVRTVSHFRIPALKEHVPLKLLVSLDALLQPTGRLWQLSPSVFTQAVAVGEGAGAPAGAFWRCPRCGALDMAEEPTGVLCGTCGHLWPIEDGIYVFKEIDKQGPGAA